MCCCSSQGAGKPPKIKNKAPKQHIRVQVLLQESLRPILVQLGYHSKLQLPLLQGLARLLQLLSSWFNITLGARCPPQQA